MKAKKYHKVHDVRIEASHKWWRKFEKWRKDNDFRTRSEAIRQAINMLTK